jgi:fructose-1,6-bisphosphatase I
MAEVISLKKHLDKWSELNSERIDIAEVIQCIAVTSIKLSQQIARSALDASSHDAVTENADGDIQKPLDILAHRLFEDAFWSTAVGLMVSEESEKAIVLNKQGSIAVAIDPLDGSSNIETNLSIGTIFSIFPQVPNSNTEAKNLLIERSGSDQAAAGFVVFGPQTTLVLTCLDGTHIFALDAVLSKFFLVRENIVIPPAKREFAINASNYHYWDEPVREYVDDCIAGQSGPRGTDFNMRWAASLVAEAYRIFVRGGIFLYPRDSRPNYQNGRLRLVYEAFPIALLVEQAGGTATDGEHRILDRKITEIHERVPLVFGSKDKVERVARYYCNPSIANKSHPLFTSRTLLRN